MKGMTLNDVAHSGTHKQWMELNSYYRIEKGDVNISICTLSAIAKALDIHPSELLKF
jgi:transcriptional regulator with XRE-family HTH domain